MAYIILELLVDVMVHTGPLNLVLIGVRRALLEMCDAYADTSA